MTEVLTPAEMTFLIGSKFLPNADITDDEIKAATGGLKGDGSSMALASRTVMAGLLALRDEGSISMEYVERKKLGVFTSRHIMAAKTQESSYVMPRLEGELAHFIESEPKSVAHVVGKWFGPQVESPAVKAYSAAWHHLVECGMIVIGDEEVERGKVGRALSGKKTKTQTEAKPNVELIATALPQLSQWARRWTTFLRDEGEFYNHLTAEVTKTLQGKQRTETDSSD